MDSVEATALYLGVVKKNPSAINVCKAYTSLSDGIYLKSFMT